MLPYLSKLLIALKSLLQKKCRRKIQRSALHMAADEAGRDTALLPLLLQENPLQLLQRKGLCPDVCSKHFLLVMVPWGSGFDNSNEFYIYFYNYFINSVETLDM